MKRIVDGERFYTSRPLAAACLARLAAHVDLTTFDVVLEPGAGDGAFFALLPPATRVGIDLCPAAEGIAVGDFFDWRPPARADRIATVGNPPFGQRGALAVRFLNHACSFSEVVAFILPRSFKKWTFQNRVDPQFALVDGFDCDDFVVPDAGRVAVRATFQIWQRQDVMRPQLVPPDAHPDFTMRHAHLSRTDTATLAALRAGYHFTIPQVGSDFRPRDVTGVTRGSHWFIRIADDACASTVRARFAALDFSFLAGTNTAHTSLSKRDIVAAYRAAAGE